MKKKILIIDDNIDLQAIFRIHFEAAWYLVYTSSDGMQWVTKLLECQPDIILLDIMMPQMNGYEVLDTIRNHSSIHIPVIVCSSLSQASDIQKTYESWADGYIKKAEVWGEEIVKQVSGFLKEHTQSL